jgi:hypothetical protein
LTIRVQAEYSSASLLYACQGLDNVRGISDRW